MTATAPWDVVVVGAGPGGCATAIEAARGGARVVLLEAGQDVGGNAARSTGYLAFAGTAMQRAAGIADDAERFLADMRAEIARQEERYGLVFDEALARVVAEESADAHDFLVDLGFRFNRFIPRPRQHTVDRMVDVADVAMFRDLFGAELERLGVDVRLRTRAVRLVVDGRAVVGVVARGPDGRTDELRGGAVVLAAGGYQGNVELRRRYQPAHLAATPFLGVHTDVGDGHVMGQAVGGDLINMTMVPPLVMVASAFVEDAMAVNRDGVRFHDEAGPYDDRVAALLAQPDRLAWYVYDDRVARERAVLIEQMPEAPVTAGSVEELAERLGVDPTALARTVARWNAAVAAGRDDDHGRVVFPSSRRGVVDAPFHACRMVVGINFPAGGFRVTTDLQVVDVYGVTIPGLFAVGDCVGGVAPAIGLGGLKITPAIVMGRRVGRAVAAGAVGTATAAGTGLLVDAGPPVTDRGMRIAVVDDG